MSVINGLYYGEDALNSYGALTVDVYASKWVGDTAPYTYTTPIPEEYKHKALFMYDLVPIGDSITENERIAFAYISNTTTVGNNIVFTANERKPGVDIKVALRSSINEGVSSIKGILGTRDISKIGDGTLTGALNYLSEQVSDIVINLPTTGWVSDSNGYYYVTIDMPNIFKVLNPIYSLKAKTNIPNTDELTEYEKIVSLSIDTGRVTVYTNAPIEKEISIVVKGCARVDTSPASTFIIVTKDCTVNTSDWVLNNKTQEYEATIQNPDITERLVVDVMIHKDYLDSAVNSGVSELTESFDGGFKLFSDTKPETMVIDYMIIGTGSSSYHAYGLVGDVSDLKTQNRKTIIDAINEVYNIATINSGSSGDGGISTEIVGVNDISKLGDGTLTGAINHIANTMTDLFLINGVTLEQDAWVLNADTNKYEATIADARITDNLIVNVNVKDPDSTVVANSGISNSTESFNGGVRIFSTNKPEGDIECDCVVLGLGGSTAIDMIGSISSLNTTSKESIVSAINELNTSIKRLESIVNSGN